MKQHLLVTDEMKATMPKELKVVFDAGRIGVVFHKKDSYDTKDIEFDMYGDNMILEGEQETFINWLKEFDGIAVGNGVPQLEQFEIMHIKEELT